MQVPGDICKGCKDHWESKGKSPRTLRILGSTINKKIVVPGCDYCDGEPIFTHKDR